MSLNNARTNMIKQQLRTNLVLNESILDLYNQVPRHEFLPSHLAHFAYSDMQIPLEFGQRMLTPLEEALILQALALTGRETVLEIGTGTGFFTALLSKLCQKVISVDYYSQFTSTATANLKAHHCDNVQLITGDGCRGWIEEAPYDVIVFTGTLEALTQTHRLQIVPGGQLFAFIGKSPRVQGRLFQLDHNEVWHESMLFETDLPPLIDCLKPKEFVF
jgi:protein-L-isoaspartate(D-aspartate) O-methyltransferase